MPRPKYQLGGLYKVGKLNPHWQGDWYIYQRMEDGSQRRKHRTANLGTLDIPEHIVRAKLLKIINGETLQSKALEAAGKTPPVFGRWVSSSTSNARLGAASELLVAADMLRLGYEVYRAFSPQAQCDLLAVKTGRVLRVEVKSVSFSRNGAPKYHLAKKIGKFDVMALVNRDGSIHYRTPEDLGLDVQNPEGNFGTCRKQIAGTPANIGDSDGGVIKIKYTTPPEPIETTVKREDF